MSQRSGHSTRDGRLLVFDCHEAWVSQLLRLEQPMDVIVGLKGRDTPTWDAAIRPVPENARIVRLEQALETNQAYGCIITHNLSDLLDVKLLERPRLLVIHDTIDAMVAAQRSTTPPQKLRHAVAHYGEKIGAHVMPVSKIKGASWGFQSEKDIVPFSADPADYLPHCR